MFMDKGEKVVHLSSVHHRGDVRIFIKECCSLLSAGFEVFFVVADGKGDEIINGIKIKDVGKATNRYLRIINTVNKVYKKASNINASVYHIHDPELLRIAPKLSQSQKNTHVIYDSHEDLPRQIMSKHWIPSRLRRSVSIIAERYENNIVSKLSGVVTATPYIRDRFDKINSNVINVNNYPIPTELLSTSNPIKKKNQICYVGGISETRGIKQLVEALPFLPWVHLVLCGPFMNSSFIEELKALPGWQQVDYKGTVNRDTVRSVMSESSAGLVTLLPTPNHIFSYPIKMFEYMSAKLPVIASDFSLWKSIIESNECGLCVDPLSPESVANSVEKILRNPDEADRMGNNGRNAILYRYNWPHEAKKLIQFYKEL